MIDDTLYDAFGQRQVSTLFTQLNQYHVVLEALPDFQNNPAKLKDIYVRSSATAPTSPPATGSAASVAIAPSTPTATTVGSSAPAATTIIPTTSTINGAAVPLSAFPHFEFGTAPLAINNQGQFPVVTISLNLAPGASLGAATNAIQQAPRTFACR